LYCPDCCTPSVKKVSYEGVTVEKCHLCGRLSALFVRLDGRVIVEGNLLSYIASVFPPEWLKCGIREHNGVSTFVFSQVSTDHLVSNLLWFLERAGLPYKVSVTFVGSGNKRTYADYFD